MIKRASFLFRDLGSLTSVRRFLAPHMTKAFILSEIKRLATENEGIALGGGRFAARTGIKQSDWLGRFWVRWSDAIAEAGFQANQMREAYNLDDLLGHLVALIRKLQKFPTAAELKFEAHTSPGFPSSNTFQTRLGHKAKMAQAVLDYCGNDSGLESVAAICREVITVPASEELDSEDTEEETFGYVYLIKAGIYYKIGKANSVERRFSQLRIQLPDRAELVHQITTDDPFGIEAYWHNRFRDKRSNGEWFSLSRQDIKAFKRRKFM